MELETFVVFEGAFTPFSSDPGDPFCNAQVLCGKVRISRVSPGLHDNRKICALEKMGTLGRHDLLLLR